eukprot:TRINITY_DN1726_c0_g1_i2.p1 TRINITY_DN1726_c0_g1~~TRINITY_DN1726_c0_g1_i2.p1  ORF type:complete len:1492 (+),score=483.37 TRINITY_DN1726_c0_g1_i2:3200-7675(+)
METQTTPSVVPLSTALTATAVAVPPPVPGHQLGTQTTPAVVSIGGSQTTPHATPAASGIPRPSVPPLKLGSGHQAPGRRSRRGYSCPRESPREPSASSQPSACTAPPSASGSPAPGQSVLAAAAGVVAVAEVSGAAGAAAPSRGASESPASASPPSMTPSGVSWGGTTATVPVSGYRELGVADRAGSATTATSGVPSGLRPADTPVESGLTATPWTPSTPSKQTQVSDGSRRRAMKRVGWFGVREPGKLEICASDERADRRDVKQQERLERARTNVNGAVSAGHAVAGEIAGVVSDAAVATSAMQVGARRMLFRSPPPDTSAPSARGGTSVSSCTSDSQGRVSTEVSTMALTCSSVESKRRSLVAWAESLGRGGHCLRLSEAAGRDALQEQQRQQRCSATADLETVARSGIAHDEQLQRSSDAVACAAGARRAVAQEVADGSYDCLCQGTTAWLMASTPYLMGAAPKHPLEDITADQSIGAQTVVSQYYETPGMSVTEAPREMQSPSAVTRGPSVAITLTSSTPELKEGNMTVPLDNNLAGALPESSKTAAEQDGAAALGDLTGAAAASRQELEWDEKAHWAITAVRRATEGRQSLATEVACDALEWVAPSLTTRTSMSMSERSAKQFGACVIGDHHCESELEAEEERERADVAVQEQVDRLHTAVQQDVGAVHSRAASLARSAARGGAVHGSVDAAALAVERTLASVPAQPQQAQRTDPAVLREHVAQRDALLCDEDGARRERQQEEAAGRGRVVCEKGAGSAALAMRRSVKERRRVAETEAAEAVRGAAACGAADSLEAAWQRAEDEELAAAPAPAAPVCPEAAPSFHGLRSAEQAGRAEVCGGERVVRAGAASSRAISERRAVAAEHARAAAMHGAATGVETAVLIAIDQAPTGLTEPPPQPGVLPQPDVAGLVTDESAGRVRLRIDECAGRIKAGARRSSDGARGAASEVARRAARAGAAFGTSDAAVQAWERGPQPPQGQPDGRPQLRRAEAAARAETESDERQCRRSVCESRETTRRGSVRLDECAGRIRAGAKRSSGAAERTAACVAAEASSSGVVQAAERLRRSIVQLDECAGRAATSARRGRDSSHRHAAGVARKAVRGAAVVGAGAAAVQEEAAAVADKDRIRTELEDTSKRERVERTELGSAEGAQRLQLLRSAVLQSSERRERAAVAADNASGRATTRMLHWRGARREMSSEVAAEGIWNTLSQGVASAAVQTILEQASEAADITSQSIAAALRAVIMEDLVGLEEDEAGERAVVEGAEAGHRRGAAASRSLALAARSALAAAERDEAAGRAEVAESEGERRCRAVSKWEQGCVDLLQSAELASRTVHAAAEMDSQRFGRQQVAEEVAALSAAAGRVVRSGDAFVDLYSQAEMAVREAVAAAGVQPRLPGEPPDEDDAAGSVVAGAISTALSGLKRRSREEADVPVKARYPPRQIQARPPDQPRWAEARPTQHRVVAAEDQSYVAEVVERTVRRLSASR